MRDRLTYLCARPSPLRQAIRTPALLLSNALFYALYLPYRATVRVRFKGDWQDELRATAHSERPIIYYSWHRNSWCMAGVVLGFPPDLAPSYLAHDHFVSEAHSWSAGWLGLRVVHYGRSSHIEPRQQIIRFVQKTHRHLLIFADSAGPYGQLKPGMVEIAEATNALLVPVGLDVTPDIRVGHTWRHRLHIPAARVDVRVGQALEGTNATLAQAQQALEALEPW